MEIEARARQTPSVDKEEMRHFSALAKEWWAENGKFRALHAFNPARLAFIVAEVRRWRGETVMDFKALAGLSILDIGCGGGILCEPLARLGAEVTGIDPVEESIAVAKAHAEKQALHIDYRATTAEDIAREAAGFDVVIASEVIEHVADVPSFLRTCRALCKDRGLIVISTLNRTARSYALAIVAAEKVLRLIPTGTHDWKKFLTPAELASELREAGFTPKAQNGIVLKPLSGSWALSASDLTVNYIVSAEAR